MPPTLPPGNEYTSPNISEISPAQWELLGYGAVKVMPPDLEVESQPIEPPELVAEWTDLLNNSRMIVNGDVINRTGKARSLGDFDLLFCEAGYGVVMGLPASVEQGPVGSVFDWHFEHSAASPWWNATLVLEPADITFVPGYPQFTNRQAESHRRSLFVIGEDAWIDGMLGVELQVTVLGMSDPAEFCSDTPPASGRLF